MSDSYVKRLPQLQSNDQACQNDSLFANSSDRVVVGSQFHLAKSATYDNKIRSKSQNRSHSDRFGNDLIKMTINDYVNHIRLRYEGLICLPAKKAGNLQPVNYSAPPLPPPTSFLIGGKRWSRSGRLDLTVVCYK